MSKLKVKTSTFNATKQRYPFFQAVHDSNHSLDKFPSIYVKVGGETFVGVCNYNLLGH